jgi:hypothetical protein
MNISPESLHCFLMLNPSPWINKITNSWLKTENRKRGKRSTSLANILLDFQFQVALVAFSLNNETILSKLDVIVDDQNTAQEG